MMLEDLARVLSLHSRTIRGPAIGTESLIASLVDLGILVPAGTVERILCDRCDEPHFAEIMNIPEGQGWYCTSDGLVIAKPAEVAAFRVRAEAFVGILAADMDRQRHSAKPRENPMLWSVGSVTVHGLRVAMYFSVNAGQPHVFNEVVQLLASEPRAAFMAVLTNDTRDLRSLHLPWCGKLVPIADCIDISPTARLQLNREFLSCNVIPTDLLPTSKPGRHDDKGQLALDLIRELDADRALRKITSARERNRRLERAAKDREGDATTLSRGTCDKAWSIYRRGWTNT